jgi:hypothetical protein
MAGRNVIVIVADTLRHPRTLPGGGAGLMPFLDGLAARGLVFDRMFASSSWTAPSHVSLLTGSDPWQTHFHVAAAGRRAPQVEGLAGHWSKMGGVSAGFSANFLVAPELGTATGYTRFNPGFPSGLAGALQYATTYLGYERVLYRATARPGAGHRGPAQRAWDSACHFAGGGLYKAINELRTGELLLRSLKGFLAARPRDAPPLHLFFNLVEPHEPYLVGQNAGPAGSPVTAGHLPSINLARFNDLLVQRNETPSFLEVYRRSLTATDDVLRGIFDQLGRAGILDNAVVAFLSDHGQNFGEHGFYGHGFFLYDELVKVPAFVWEFRNGQPIALSAPPAEWIDHRHFFDLMASATPDGPPLDVAEVLGASLVRRGPACAYYEGPGIRPPDGLFRKAPKPAPYRILRVQQGSGTAMMSSDLKGEQLTQRATESADTFSEELAEIARQILTHEIGAPAAEAGPATALDAQVDARLKSWGYD